MNCRWWLQNERNRGVAAGGDDGDLAGGSDEIDDGAELVLVERFDGTAQVLDVLVNLRFQQVAVTR